MTRARKDRLPSTIHFDFVCEQCPGDGVIRGARPGIDWPRPCPCGARKRHTNHTLGSILKESPVTLVRVAHLRSSSAVAERVLTKLVERGLA